LGVFVTSPVTFSWTAWVRRGGAAGGGVGANPLCGSATAEPGVGGGGCVVLGEGVGVGAGIGNGAGGGAGVGGGGGPYPGGPYPGVPRVADGKLESRAHPSSDSTEGQSRRFGRSTCC